MHLVIWIAMGTAAGLLAQFVLEENWRIGLYGSLVLGAIGAVVVSSALRLHGVGAPGTSILGLVVAFGGAAALLWARRFDLASRPIG